MSSNAVQKMRKSGKRKFRLGYAFFMIFFVVLAAMAMIVNVTMARQHTMKRERIALKNEQLEMPKLRHHHIDAESEAEPQVVVQQHHTAGEGDTDKHSKVHVVFSTSCHVKQDWQSYLFFFSAMVMDQQGTVTRIVSGCTPDQEVEITKVFEEQIAIMSDRFRLHFTPEFGRVEGKSYQSTKYWNKPFSLRHWLENVFGYDFDQNILSTPLDDDVVVLVDPDMLMQRPFVNHFPTYMDDLWIAPIRNGEIYDKVSHGKPMAQDYSFGSAWLMSSASNLTHVVGPDSPVHGVSDWDARAYYSAGPPYIATARDMYQISYYWTTFLPRIFDLFPKFMAEMYGYCMAAAHLQLKHQLAQGFMVSNVFFKYAEGWSFLDHVTDNACDVEQFKDVVPQVIHFCQRYSIGEFFLSKYKLPAEIISCDSPLLELPPLDIAAYTNYSHYGDGSFKVWQGEQEKIFMYRNTYMVCSLMPAINKAATFYKDHNCPGGANYEQTWNTFPLEEAKQ
jgi:hypothetical protein